MKDLKIYIIIASALLVVYLVAQYNKPKATDWTETLCDTNKIPFGTYILQNRINDIFPGAKLSTYREPVYNVITNDHITDGTYIIIADEVNINKYDYEQLTRYIKKGNDVFIAASSFGRELYDTLGIVASQAARHGSTTRIGFVNTALKDNLYDVDKHSSDGYFNAFKQSEGIVLGENEFKDATYLEFKMGKGALFLNANPKMFTNYSLLQDMGAAYSSIALSFVKNNKNVVWDEYYTQGRVGSESDMRVFLNNINLRWAFYIAFFSLVAFVLYEMKRRQRIIPVIEPLKNTSVEFAGIVGQVYYEQRNNTNIAQKKAEYFMEHIRTEYSLRTNVLDEEFRNALVQKSGATPELISTLVTQVVNVRIGSHINDTELIDLNRSIEQFYIEAR
jgi:hypothetical protein